MAVAPSGIAAGSEAAAVVVGRPAAIALPLAVKHGQVAVETFQHNFGAVVVLAVLSLPFAGAQLTFDVELAAFFDEAFDNVCKAFVEDDNAMPFGTFAAFTRLTVAPLFGGRNAEIGDLFASLGKADFRIAPELSRRG